MNAYQNLLKTFGVSYIFLFKTVAREITEIIAKEQFADTSTCTLADFTSVL